LRIIVLGLIPLSCVINVLPVLFYYLVLNSSTTIALVLVLALV
jgi:hypothetical protein